MVGFRIGGLFLDVENGCLVIKFIFVLVLDYGYGFFVEWELVDLYFW